MLGHLVISIRECMRLYHGSTLRSVFELHLTLIMFLGIMGHFGSLPSLRVGILLNHKLIFFLTCLNCTYLVGNPMVNFGGWLLALWLLKSEPSQYDLD